MKERIGTRIDAKNLYRRELAWIRRGGQTRSTKQKARNSAFDEAKGTRKDQCKTSVDIALAVAVLGKKVLS